MLNTTFLCESHNIHDEILFVYTSTEIVKGHCFENESMHIFDIHLEVENVNSNIDSNYISLKKSDVKKIEEGDILHFTPDGRLRVVFSISSKDNVLFLTNQCNNTCLMCSQPPSKANDLQYFYFYSLKLIELLPMSVSRLGITGGEPTLQGKNLINILTKINKKFPGIELQLLSNGRSFENIEFVRDLSKVEISHLIVGIPIHSDYYLQHDAIAQSKGAFNQTLKGLYNLARFGIAIELRVILNKMNKERLEYLSDYIFKNLPFTSHITFMGMEHVGLAVKNDSSIWIDPTEYKIELKNAVLDLASWGLNVSIFNIPLCLLDSDIRQYSKISISDWKIKYFEECNQCALMQYCGGDFSTSTKNSKYINAIKKEYC